MKEPLFLIDRIREWIAPSQCALCSADLFEGLEIHRGLCEACQTVLRLPFPPSCPFCGRPLISEEGVCIECRQKEKPFYDAVVALYPYGGVYRNLLAAYKFHRHRPLANFFLIPLQEALDYVASIHFPVDALVPVPPRPGKLKKNGWDQIEYLAKKWEKTASIPLLRCLRRSASRSQKELNREQRSVNLKGKIQCTTVVPPTIAIIDDVITTGATLNACAEALRASGAQRIYGIVLFYD